RDWSSDVCSSDLQGVSAFHRKHRTNPRRNGWSIPVRKRIHSNQGRRRNKDGIPHSIASELHYHADDQHPKERQRKRGDDEIKTRFRQRMKRNDINNRVQKPRDNATNPLENSAQHRVLHVPGEITFLPRKGIRETWRINSAPPIERNDVVVTG